MSTPRSPADRPYSLLDGDVSPAHPRFPLTLATRLRGAGPHCLVTACLAALCAVLLISIIAVAARDRNTTPRAGEEASNLQKQTQDANLTALSATISKLQKEKDQLQKEKDQLETEKDQLETEKDQLQKEKDQLETEKDQLQKEKDQLQKEKDQLETEKDQLQKEKDQLQKEKDQLQKEKHQLQKEKDQLLARLPATKAPEVFRPTPEPPPASVSCPMDWSSFGGSCYFISTASRNWEAAQSMCQQHGAHLAIIHTAEEQTFLWNLLPRGHWNAYWFGITDEHTEDQWKWVDGTPLVGGFWEEGEPNNHIDEDCGYMVKTRVMERVATRSWYDAPCSMYRPYICEKEMNATITTTA